MRRIFAFLALALLAAPLAAQSNSSKSATNTATIHVDGQLTWAATTAMNFGTVFSNAGVVTSSSVPTTAQFAGSVSAGANLSVSMTIPTTLSDGVGHTLAFACGTTSGLFHADQGAQQGFNPATGISSYSVPATSSGALLLTLGQDPGTGSCTVDVGTLQSGGLFKTYQANIVATVTVL
jgi:hypothetical protein